MTKIDPELLSIVKRMYFDTVNDSISEVKVKILSQCKKRKIHEVERLLDALQELTIDEYRMNTRFEAIERNNWEND